MKTCKSCHAEKQETEFYGYKDGRLQPNCKACKKDRSLRWYADNRERVLANVALYRQNNPEKCREIKREWEKRYAAELNEFRRQWARDHPESRRKSRAKWNDANRERIAKVNSAWQKANREACSAYWAAYHASKLNATPKWADLKAISRVYAEARRLTKETGIQHQVDHTVPLNGETVRGLHVVENLQILPASDNSRKGNRVWPQMP